MGSGRGTPSPSGIRPPVLDRSARRSEDPEHVWNEAATSCVLLRHLPAHEQKSMRTSCRTVKLRPKMVVYKQKSFSDVFYVVQSGRYVATLDADGTNEERIVREYNKGDTFGSHELYFSQPRTTTVTAIDGGAVWCVEKRFFATKLRDPPSPPDPELCALIRKAPVFRELSNEHIEALARAAHEEPLASGQELCKQGDAATSIYIVASGEVVTTTSGTDHEFKIGSLECFGESALYPEAELRVRRETVTAAAAEGTAVLRFEVADIEALIGFVLQDQAVRTYNRKLLGSVRLDKRRLTHGLTPATIDWLVDQLHEEEYVEGYNIAPEGTVDQTLYIVKRGRVIVYTESVGEVAQLSPGDFFGELSLVPRRVPRTCSIVARGPGKVTVLQLPSDVFLTSSNSELQGVHRDLLNMFNMGSSVKENTASSAASQQPTKRAGRSCSGGRRGAHRRATGGGRQAGGAGAAKADGGGDAPARQDVASRRQHPGRVGLRCIPDGGGRCRRGRVGRDGQRQAAGADQPPAEDAAEAAARSIDGSGGEREVAPPPPSRREQVLAPSLVRAIPSRPSGRRPPGRSRASPRAAASRRVRRPAARPVGPPAARPVGRPAARLAGRPAATTRRRRRRARGRRVASSAGIEPRQGRHESAKAAGEAVELRDDTYTQSRARRCTDVCRIRCERY